MQAPVYLAKVCGPDDEWQRLEDGEVYKNWWQPPHAAVSPNEEERYVGKAPYRYPDGSYGWRLRTTVSHKAGDKVIPGPASSLPYQDALNLANMCGWEWDFFIRDAYKPNKFWFSADWPLMPVYGNVDRVDRPEDLPAEQDGGARFPWRIEGGHPPAGCPDWYFLDHSTSPNLLLNPRYAILSYGDTIKKCLVFEAARDIEAGEWLTFNYGCAPADWH